MPTTQGKPAEPALNRTARLSTCPGPSRTTGPPRPGPATTAGQSSRHQLADAAAEHRQGPRRSSPTRFAGLTDAPRPSALSPGGLCLALSAGHFLGRHLLRREPVRGQTLSHQPPVACRFSVTLRGVASIRRSSGSNSGGGTSWTALGRPLLRREPARGQTLSHQPPVVCHSGVPLRGVAPTRRSSAFDSGGGTSWAVGP